METRDDERNAMLSILAGIGIGAIVGAVAGLLLAPKSGRETRDDLGQRMNDLGDRLSDLGEEMGDRMRSAGTDLGSRVRSAVDAGRRAVNQQRRGGEDGVTREEVADIHTPAAGV